jgi:flagellar biosynthetic protein FliS
MLDPFSKYRAATAMTTDSNHQLLFIFDEVIKLLYQAKRAIGEQDIEAKYKILNRATEVFYILKSGTDAQQGENHKKIDNFYGSTISALERANISATTPEDLDPLINGLKEVRNALKESKSASVE